MTKQEQEQILTNFGLQFEEIESLVYKIINTSKEVNVDELKCALKECALMVSDDIRNHI